MRQARHRQQRDHRAVMRQRVHAARGHRGDTVQHFHRNIRGLRGGDERPDMAASAMDMPPDAEPVMPASVVTVTASLTSGLGMALKASLTTRKPGKAAMTAPKPYSEAVFIDGQQSAADRRLAAFGEGFLQLAEGEDEDGQNAGQQRAFHRPDGADRRDRRRR